MSTLTKEWLLKTIAELEEERDAVPGVVNEDAAKALAAMKLALASLKAEPVSVNDDMAYAFHHAISDSSLGSDEVEEIKAGLRAAFANVTVQPAPVSVLFAIHDEDFEKALSVLNDTLDDCGDSERGLLLALDKVGIEVRSDARHAAMLQGAEPVTTAYKLPFEQWLSQQTGTIDVECGCVMTEVFFHWLRVAYEAGNSPVIPDGYALVPVEPTTNQWAAGMQAFDSGMDKVTRVYKAMLAAAPQQEVK